MLEKPSLLPLFFGALGSIGVINPSERLLACFPLAAASEQRTLRKSCSWLSPIGDKGLFCL